MAAVRRVLSLVFLLLLFRIAPAHADAPAVPVWVVGDSTAQPLEQGFQALHKEDARLHVRTFFKNSSGLIRTDIIDWPKTMRAELANGAPAVVVLTFGPNDAQGMMVPGKRTPVSLGTEEWRDEYARRVRAFADLFLARGCLVYLLTQPFDETKKHAPVMRDVNAAFGKAVALPGDGQDRLALIDVPALIERGAHERAAASPDKKPAPLKNADGIHLTFAGGKWLSRHLTERIAGDAVTRAGNR